MFIVAKILSNVLHPWSELHFDVLAGKTEKQRCLHSRLRDNDAAVMMGASKQREPAKRKLLFYLQCMTPLVWSQAINNKIK